MYLFSLEDFAIPKIMLLTEVHFLLLTRDLAKSLNEEGI